MTRGEQASPTRAVASTPTARDDSHLSLAPSRPVRLENLYLLDPSATDTTPIDALVFSDEGIGVIEHRGQPPRVLPWSSVSAHVVEAWSGGVVPEWWIDPELEGEDADERSAQQVTDPDARVRGWPHVEPGSLIGVQTPTGTYRFLLPGTDPVSLSGRINAIAVRHRGPTAIASVTTVAETGRSRGSGGRAETRSTWSKVQPYLVVALVLFIAASVTLILLQSAGTIHLPFLGGANSGSLGRVAVELRTG